MKKKFQIKYLGLFLATWVLFLPSLWAQINSPSKFRLPIELREVSGLAIVSSDSLWWHNDSGNGNELFLTNQNGDLIDQKSIGSALNRDWEDISIDGEGRLYIGDFGDNRRRRDTLVIYRYDPGTQLLDSVRFSYPNHRHFDVEAMYWYQDSIHLFTKSRIGRGDLWTYEFIVPFTGADINRETTRNETDQQPTIMAELRDSITIRKRVVTGAAIDEESGQVALIAYYYTKRLGFIPYSAANIYVIDNAPEGYVLRGRWRKKRISLLVATQYESIDFLTPEQLLVASEQTLFIKAKAKRIRLRRGKREMRRR